MEDLSTEADKYTNDQRLAVIVVATDDFEIYHEVVSELQERGVPFCTVEPDAKIPVDSSVVITDESNSAGIAKAQMKDNPHDLDTISIVEATPGRPREAVEKALTVLRGEGARTVVGIDPGDRPGVAVLSGDVVVATFEVAPSAVPSLVAAEVADAPDPLVRIGDGARLVGARIIDDLEDVPVELVDETGTTPYLGEGARGVGDIVAAINIARREGDRIETRDVEPTVGELDRIKQRSRKQSQTNRAIDTDLARRVAAGELTVEEALEEHREKTG